MENNLDVNILMQTFTERIAQMSNDIIVKDAIITQFKSRIDELEKQLEELSDNDKKKDK